MLTKGGVFRLFSGIHCGDLGGFAVI